MKRALLPICTILITLSLTAAHITVGDTALHDNVQLDAVGKPATVSMTCDSVFFEPAGNFGGDQENRVVEVGDVNGDGKKDIIYAGSWSDIGNPNYEHGSMPVLLGDGIGGFSAVDNPFRLTGVITSIAVGEFNGDGRDDVAVLWYTNSTGETGLSTFLGNAAGGFDPGVSQEAY